MCGVPLAQHRWSLSRPFIHWTNGFPDVHFTSDNQSPGLLYRGPGKTTVSDRHQKYTYLFPFHVKGAGVRFRVAVRGKVNSLLTESPRNNNDRPK